MATVDCWFNRFTGQGQCRRRWVKHPCRHIGPRPQNCPICRTYPCQHPDGHHQPAAYWQPGLPLPKEAAT